MMELRKKYYDDIRFSIVLIEDFLADIDSIVKYKRDIKTKSAVERQLSIIGEAVKKLKEIDQSDLINFQANIIGFRNRLVHAYDSIDDEIVWVIVKKHLPLLKIEVTEKLK